MPNNARIIGAARANLGRAGYQDMVRQSINEFGGLACVDTKQFEFFLNLLEYVTVDVRGESGWA